MEDSHATLGFVPIEIARQLPLADLWQRDDDNKTLILLRTAADELSFNRRNKLLAEYLENVRQQKLFKVLEGWRNELYPVYGPNRKVLLHMERSATPLFGVVTYGVHMTGFVRSGGDLKIWTPRRSPTKETYPGMMDNTVAGGLTLGEQPFDCLIREAQEEASLPERVARNAKPCGTLTYFHVRDERAGGETGLCQPECQYIYDLEIPPDVVPQPEDGEAIDFRLLSVAEVQKAMATGQFKPNCALLLLEFFVRQGILSHENEPNYIDIVARLHRKFEFPMA